jgi:hypothetical protein
MHPEIARTIAAQHHEELARLAAETRRRPVRRLPRWHVSWFRAREPRGSSVMIIISAHRPA